MPDTYTVKQVADALGFSTNTVYKYLEEGKIKATRLGSEGRFRIPTSEVEKLLGKATPPTDEPISLSSDIIPHNKTVSPPELFDWLLSLTAIFCAVSQLANPIRSAAIALGNYHSLFIGSQIALAIFGSMLFTLDMFSIKRIRLLSLLARIPLTCTFGLISFIHFSTGDIWQSTYFGVLALFSAVSIVWPQKYFETKLVAFMFLLISISAIGFAQNPQSFIFGDVRYQVTSNPNGFIATVISISAIIASILIFSHKRSKVLYPIFTTATGLFFLATTVNYITTGDWSKTIISLFTGCFALILPLSSQIENFTRYTRSQLVYGFAWIVCSIVVGVVGIQVVKATTGTLSLKSAHEKVESTAKIADRSISDASLNIIRATSDDRFQNLTIDQKTETELLEISKNMYFTSSLARRVFFSDANGTAFGIYPPIATTVTSIAHHAFFQQTKSTGKTIISDVIIPTIPNLPSTVYISSPIKSANDEFKGTIVMAIDPQLLHDRLTLMSQNPDNEVVISDSNGNFLFGEDKLPKEVAEKQTAIVFDKANNLVVQTKSHATSLGWNVILVQPYDAVFKESVAVSSMIFFISTVLGIGSLLVSIHLPHQKYNE